MSIKLISWQCFSNFQNTSSRGSQYSSIKKNEAMFFHGTFLPFLDIYLPVSIRLEGCKLVLDFWRDMVARVPRLWSGSSKQRRGCASCCFHGLSSPAFSHHVLSMPLHFKPFFGTFAGHLNNGWCSPLFNIVNTQQTIWCVLYFVTVWNQHIQILSVKI